MTTQPTGISKRFLARGSRHNGECYGAVLDPNGTAIAYMLVDGTRESLVCRPTPDSDAIPLCTNTYVLSPCFAGPHLFWVEHIGNEWRLKSTAADAPSPDNVSEPVPIAGRPLSLGGSSNDETAVLVWEERSGKKTRVRMVSVGQQISAPVDVTDGSYNAYDPNCCIMPDGTVRIVCCAFRGGQYRIETRAVAADGRLVDEPMRLSNQPHACLHPSVCVRPEGGVWFSYTCLDTAVTADRSFIKHHRFRAQRSFFQHNGSLYLGILDDGRTCAVHAPPDHRQKQGFTAAMFVCRSSGADNSHVLTDATGRLHLLARHHGAPNSIDYRDGADPLAAATDHPPRAPRNEHPNISLFTLDDARWAEPACLVPKAHAIGPVSFGTDGNRLRVAFTEDSRYTGWAGGGEWFDSEGQLGVGVAEVELPARAAPDYKLFPYRIAPADPPSIENPSIEKRHDGFIHAMGQTHMHSNLSVCRRDNDRDQHQNYRFTQDVQHSDFGGTTDHAYNMWHTEMLMTRKLADYYYFPGEFVGIPAYEWTGSGGCEHEGGPWGHVNPLFLEEDGDLDFVTPCDPDCPGSSLPKTWDLYRGKQIVAPPHHVADNMHWYNWEGFDRELAPVIEIFQDSRGSGEHPDAPGVTNFLHREEGHWALPELKKGKRFGFIAGADHSGIALAGLLVKELTRSGLYEAFMARRTFGTTGLEMRVLFTCNGEPMGSEIAADSADFELSVVSPEPVTEIHIVRNGEDVEHVPVAACEASHAWQATREQPGEFWYCRVLLHSGEMAWTSPVWLD